MDGIRVLIADDNQTDRKLLSRLVRQQGGLVTEAADGEEAIAQFDAVKPDLVLMDVMMPVMDGRQAARAIKARAGEDFIPVIFLTSLTDAQSLADCLESGGDDFLSKPYNPIILRAKVRSFSRMRDMHRTLQHQRDTIASHNRHMLQEQRVAKAVFDNVAHAGCLSAPNIRYMLSPLSVFNGDVLLAARKPGGGLHVLLGDFTGHGLPAAIGAMPLAEIFYGMTAKGFALRDILREINLKLKHILPLGFFCCAAVADLNFERQTVSIWMGGVPDCYLLRHDGSFEILKARHLPLGIINNDQFNDTLTDLPMTEGDRLFMWSDGIIEATDVAGEMFGEHRLHAIFARQDAPAGVFPAIQQALSEFLGAHAHSDDTTLLEVQMTAQDMTEDIGRRMHAGPAIGPTVWSMVYRLEADSLRRFDPKPLLMHIMMEVPGLRVMSGKLYVVMAELFSNALEHGVLQLSSDLKHSAQGFMQYYQQREQALQALQQGYVEIRMQHRGDGRQGTLTLEVEDSGAGFDYASRPQHTTVSGAAYSGRGIGLVQQICCELSYLGRGNVVRAVVAWPQPNKDA